MMHGQSLWSTEQLTAIVEAAPTALIVVDARGSVLLVNAQTETLFGHHRDELLGQSIDMLVPQEYRPAHPRLREGFVKSPSARAMSAGRDLFGVHKNQSRIPIEVRLNPITHNGETLVVCAVIDITERKRLEARFRATVESAPIAMVMIDPRGTMVLANRELERMFGHGHGDLLNRPVEILLPPRYRAGHASLRGAFLSDPQHRRMGAGRDLYAMRKDGSEFPVEIGLNPVTSDLGTFVLAAVADISERKRQADAMLQKANAALETSNRELQRFTMVAAHDLQTPIRTIASFTGLLQSTYGKSMDGRAGEWMTRIVNAATSLRSLVAGLLDYSRIGHEAIASTPVDLSRIAAEVAQMTRGAMRDAQGDITLGVLPVVLGDQQQLTQVLLNLVTNALKFRGEAPPRVVIDAQTDGDYSRIWVSDNGIGIAPQYTGQIFEMFKRLHTAKEYPGQGVGLALCKRIVELHGGRIWVESAPGAGSTFIFTLPNYVPEEK